VAQVQLGAGVVLVANLFGQRFHFLRQHGDATTHFVVTHFRNQHLFTDLVTVGVVVDAVIGQTAAHLIHGHVVLFGDVGDGLIELIVRDLHAHFLAHLQNDLVHDQTFEDLMTQGRVIRQLLTGLASIELNRLHQAIDVAFKHDAIIDDSRYFIDNLWGSETGIRDHGDTEKQRFPVLHTFSISINRKCGLRCKPATSQGALVR
jgi:hypothetical protein